MSQNLEAVRNAIAAYEETLAELKKVPPRAVGTTIITEGEKHFGGSATYTCSECSHSERFQFCPTWKFCPYCGAEIIRFTLQPEPETITVAARVERSEPGKRVVHIGVKV